MTHLLPLLAAAAVGLGLGDQGVVVGVYPGVGVLEVEGQQGAGGGLVGCLEEEGEELRLGGGPGPPGVGGAQAGGGVGRGGADQGQGLDPGQVGAPGRVPGHPVELAHRGGELYGVVTGDACQPGHSPREIPMTREKTLKYFVA